MRNVPLLARAGRLLGRCHAKLGEHELSVSALEAALTGTKTGALLYSEALTVRARALVAKAASAASTAVGSDPGVSAEGTGGGVGGHWSEATSKERLAEVMGRMEGGGEGGLSERLLLQGM